MCAGLFLVQLDVTVVNVAVPSLRESLGAEVGALQWIVDGYAVALASLMLAAGTLGDRYGHRRVVLGWRSSAPARWAAAWRPARARSSPPAPSRAPGRPCCCPARWRS
jgi:MFS family permease